MAKADPRGSESVAQLDVPVSEIDEVSPAFVLRRGERDVHERTPLGPFRPADQRHLRFLRKPVPLARVTRDTGTDHVFPRGRPSAIARDNVIEVQIVSIEIMSAVLAGVLVAFENVMPGKFHFLFREPIEKEEDDHPRDPDFERNGRDQLVGRSVS